MADTIKYLGEAPLNQSPSTSLKMAIKDGAVTWDKLSSEVQALINAGGDYKSNIHTGEFNAGNTTEEGWYDSVTSGRPEGSESDEKYFMYQSSNGGQVCFSRRNSGKAYHRLGIDKPWVAITHDDYSLQNASALAAQSRIARTSIAYSDWVATSSSGYSTDENTELSEVYAGNNLSVTEIDIVKEVTLKPNDIIKVRALYRTGGSTDVATYKYNSDAYIYVNTTVAKGHTLAELKSEFIKVKSMGSYNDIDFGTWQDLAFVRDYMFTSNYEYGWHYLKVNVEKEANYYLHITGNFSVAKSWLVLGEAEVIGSDTKQSKGKCFALKEASTTNTWDCYFSEALLDSSLTEGQQIGVIKASLTDTVTTTYAEFPLLYIGSDAENRATTEDGYWTLKGLFTSTTLKGELVYAGSSTIVHVELELNW